MNQVGLTSSINNAKASELCQDKTARHKLQDKSAIQGVINASWTLHKSDLLELEAEELAVYLSAMDDRCTLFLLLNPIKQE